ncbi:MAG: hypothetical protein AB7L71_02450 [Vicinamibacterales bacterium]
MTSRSKTIPLTLTSPAGLLTCHGCKHVHYTAPWGQAWDRTPHSRCSELRRNIPMVMGPHDKWLGSQIPADCPTHRQPSLLVHA